MTVKKFIIVGTQRTGSSAFAEALSFHPEIACGWEWTQRSPWHSKIRIAEQALQVDFSVLPEVHRDFMSHVWTKEKKWVGFRRLFRSSGKWLFHPGFSPALIADRFQAHLRWFARRQDIHIIHIVRTNNMAWLKSKYFSRESGMYVGNPYPENIEIRVPLFDAVARVRSKRWIDKKLEVLQMTNPYHQVKYEDFLSDKETVIKKTWEFLDCDPTKVMEFANKGRKKQSKGSIEDGISNYNELLRKLNSKKLLI